MVDEGRTDSPFQGGGRLIFRDGQAAARNFKVSSQITGVWKNNALIPKPKFLFFVEFVVPDTLPNLGVENRRNQGISDTKRFSDPKEGIVFQVKTIDKPKFNIRTETLHQYNKKRVVQTRVEYQPITINFHDDVGDRVLKFWDKYFEFYFGDNRHDTTTDWSEDKVTNEFNEGNGQGWGYIGRFLGQANNVLERANNMHFLEAIKLHEFYGGEFTTISLIHPKISSFDHDMNDYADGNTGLSIRMSFEYEGVIYDLDRKPVTDVEVEKFGFLSEYRNLENSQPAEIPSIVGQSRTETIDPRIGLQNSTQLPNTGADRLRRDIVTQTRDGERQTLGSSALGGSGFSFGSGALAGTGSNVVDMFTLSSLSGGSPSVDLIEKQTGVRNTIDNQGEFRPTANPITQIQTAPNRGLDATKIANAGSELQPAISNTEIEIGPGQTQIANRTSTNQFSKSMGAVAIVAENEGVISGVSNQVDSPNSDTANQNTFVDKFDNGTYLLTDRGAASANAIRNPNSFIGSRRQTTSLTNDNLNIDPTQRALAAERDR